MLFEMRRVPTQQEFEPVPSEASAVSVLDSEGSRDKDRAFTAAWEVPQL